MATATPVEIEHRIGADGPQELKAWRVPVVTLEPAGALDVLLSLPEGPRAWARRRRLAPVLWGGGQAGPGTGRPRATVAFSSEGGRRIRRPLAIDAGRAGRRAAQTAGDLGLGACLAVAGLALFTLGSALCGAAPSLGVLLAARCFQGLGAAVSIVFHCLGQPPTSFTPVNSFSRRLPLLEPTERLIQ